MAPRAAALSVHHLQPVLAVSADVFFAQYGSAGTHFPSAARRGSEGHTKCLCWKPFWWCPSLARRASVDLGNVRSRTPKWLGDSRSCSDQRFWLSFPPLSVSSNVASTTAHFGKTRGIDSGHVWKNTHGCAVRQVLCALVLWLARVNVVRIDRLPDVVAWL